MAQEHLAPDMVRELARLEVDAYREEFIARLGTQENLALSGFRTMIIINGGAIIGLFTFVGNSAGRGRDTTQLWAAFGLFLAGLVFTVVANFAGYFMQARYGHATTYQLWNAQKVAVGIEPEDEDARWHRAGDWWQIVAIVGIVLGIVAFAVGAGLALAALV